MATAEAMALRGSISFDGDSYLKGRDGLSTLLWLRYLDALLRMSLFFQALVALLLLLPWNIGLGPGAELKELLLSDDAAIWQQDEELIHVFKADFDDPWLVGPFVGGVGQAIKR